MIFKIYYRKKKENWEFIIMIQMRSEPENFLFSRIIDHRKLTILC